MNQATIRHQDEVKAETVTPAHTPAPVVVKEPAKEPFKNWAKDTTKPMTLADVEAHLDQLEHRFAAIDDRFKQLEHQKSKA
jgi:hypothetical protein